MTIDLQSRVGQFCGVSSDLIVEKGGRRFRIILYGAYNAFGLIGSECNGVAILDEDNKSVVCDAIAQADTGYFGPKQDQREAFKNLVNLDWEDFRAFINEHPRHRYEI